MITIITDGLMFHIRFPYSKQVIEAVKSVDGRKWNAGDRRWEVAASPGSADWIDRALHEFGYVPDEAFQSYLDVHRRAQAVLAQSAQTERATCTPCFAHQKVGLNLCLAREAFILSWDMGIGKSKTGIDLIGIAGCSRVLIACPKSVVPSWYRQFMEHGHCYDVRCVLLSRGTVARRTQIAHAAYRAGRVAIVVNYEALIRPPLRDWALEREWDLVIADEIHRLSHGKRKTSKFFDELRPKARRRLGMTGTPMPNTPLDVWAQMRFVDPGIFGTSYVAFRSRYAKMGGFQDKQVVAFKNLDELSQRFYTASHRITKDECLDLPEYMDDTREVELGKEASKAYDSMEGQFIAHLDAGTVTLTNAFVEILRLQQLTGGGIQYDENESVVDIDLAKQDAVVDILSDLAHDEPVVVFCRFHHDVDSVSTACARTGRKCHELSGRRNELDAWQASSGGEVLATQIHSGGLGVDMTRARYCIFYSLGHSLAEYEQARARLHRQGQKRSVVYYHLLARCHGNKTVDHEVYKALQRKDKVVASVLESIHRQNSGIRTEGT